MTMTRDIPHHRTPEITAAPGFIPYLVDDGTVSGYVAGSFITIASADGHVSRYALSPQTRIDAARLTDTEATLQLGQNVNLTARVDGQVSTATTIRFRSGNDTSSNDTSSNDTSGSVTRGGGDGEPAGHSLR